MLVKQRLRLTGAFSILMALIILGVLLLALHRLSVENEKAKVVGDIIVGSLESLTLRNDYVRTNRERARQQWFAKQQDIGRTLAVGGRISRSAGRPRRSCRRRCGRRRSS
jgi:hypothetical protein